MTGVIETEAVEDGGYDVTWADWPLGREAADGVAGPHHTPPLHAAASERAGKTLRPVIASAGGIHLGSAAKFGEPRDERVVEHPTLAEILDQGRVGLVVHRADDLFHARNRGERLRAVDIPGDLVKHGEKRVDRDESHAVLHQPPGQQAALAEAVHAVAVADRLRLPGEIKGLAGLCAGHQPVGGLKILVEESGVFARLKLLGSTLDDFPHLLAAIEPGHADLIGGQQIGHAEIRLRRIGHQGERILGLAQKAPRLAVGQIATTAPHQLRQHDKRGQIGAPAEEMGGDAAGMGSMNPAGEPAAGLHHLPAGVVHGGAVVAAGTHERKSIGNRRMLRQQF